MTEQEQWDAEDAEFDRCIDGWTQVIGKIMTRTYTIEPCTDGVRLKLYEDGEEMGGGFFPDDFDGAMNFAYQEAQEVGEDWKGAEFG